MFVHDVNFIQKYIIKILTIYTLSDFVHTLTNFINVFGLFGMNIVVFFYFPSYSFHLYTKYSTKIHCRCTSVFWTLVVKMIGIALVNKLKPNLNVLVLFARKTNVYFVLKLLIRRNAMVKFMLLAVKRRFAVEKLGKIHTMKHRKWSVLESISVQTKNSRQNGTIFMAYNFMWLIYVMCVFGPLTFSAQPLSMCSSLYTEYVAIKWTKIVKFDFVVLITEMNFMQQHRNDDKWLFQLKVIF